ncbi:MAG: ABC transporter substrate-binding protein [Syntrophobacteraceae bacterium]|nr:ABC transporter substrate-binding protein [Syntrophobacteraceae bacterium]
MIAKRRHTGQVRRGAILKALIPVFCLFLWTSVAAAANPEAVVQSGTNQVLDLLREYPGNPQVFRNKIRAVVDNYFDFNAIAKKALGPQWQQLSPTYRQEFTQEFSRLLFNTYIGKIQGYDGQNISYALVQQGPTRAQVRSWVAGDQNMAAIHVDYYLHLNNGKWKVDDVVIEGVGLVTSYRAQFNSILARSSFDDLLRQLKVKAAQG